MAITHTQSRGHTRVAQGILPKGVPSGGGRAQTRPSVPPVWGRIIVPPRQVQTWGTIYCSRRGERGDWSQIVILSLITELVSWCQGARRVFVGKRERTGSRVGLVRRVQLVWEEGRMRHRAGGLLQKILFRGNRAEQEINLPLSERMGPHSLHLASHSSLAPHQPQITGPSPPTPPSCVYSGHSLSRKTSHCWEFLTVLLFCLPHTSHTQFPIPNFQHLTTGDRDSVRGPPPTPPHLFAVVGDGGEDGA